MPNSGDLLDVNVWLALVAQGHSHHRRASLYWEKEAAAYSAFCRVTQLGLLRLLTNQTVMGDQVLTPAEAWRKYQELIQLSEVRFLNETAHLEEQLGLFCDQGRTSPNLWTDAYLAAFAQCHGLRLVTFDQGFSRFKGLDLLLLEL